MTFDEPYAVIFDNNCPSPELYIVYRRQLDYILESQVGKANRVQQFLGRVPGTANDYHRLYSGPQHLANTNWVELSICSFIVNLLEATN